VAAKWLEHSQEGKSLRHVDSTRRRLRDNILPNLGARPIVEIEVVMVKTIEERGARDTSAPHTSERHTRLVFSEILPPHARRNELWISDPQEFYDSAKTSSAAASTSPMIERTSSSVDL
jgi:integrase-like protein